MNGGTIYYKVSYLDKKEAGERLIFGVLLPKSITTAMDTKDLLKTRLHNQLLAGTTLKEPHEIVSFMGAMQAQVFEMAKWGIGVRLKGATNKSIEEAINAGRIIRTHILRPTWHFVAAEDLHWMLALSTPRIRPAYAGYWKIRGMDESLFIPTIRIIEKLLENGNHLTRQEISAHLVAEGIVSEHEPVHHIMGRAEIDGIVCNGPIKGNKQTYALMHEWVPKKEELCKEEALERLARKFFTSHGPATLQDFVWWSGMTLTDARKAIDTIKHDFVCEEINGRSCWMKSDIIFDHNTDSALLLPPFDEFVVSYKDRSELIEEEHYGKVMTKNGLFSPTVVLNGEIVGSWKKVVKKEAVDTELSFFTKPTKKTEALFKKPMKAFSEFYQ